MGKLDVLPLVVRLLPDRCPTTIARLVVAVVVDPIKRLAGRSRPHVRVEFSKRVPAPANANSAAAIAAIRRAALAQAPIAHARPALVFSRAAHPAQGANGAAA